MRYKYTDEEKLIKLLNKIEAREQATGSETSTTPALPIQNVRKRAFISFSWWQFILFLIAYRIFAEWITSMFF